MASRAPLIAAFGLHAALFLAAWFIPPTLNSDSGTGFLVWDSWEKGAAWNHAVAPDPGDISRDKSYFQAWWSPGQYLITAPWQKTGLSLGHAIAWGGFLVTAAGLWGYWRLFLTFGFDAAVAAWTVLAIACNWTLTRTYGDYLGGEPALLSLLPWLVLATRAVLRRDGLPWLAIPAFYWLGSMAKLSYTPMAAGLVAGFRMARWRGRPIVTLAAALEGARWLAWVGLGQLLVWWTYLRLGANPTSFHGHGNHGEWWFALVQILGFPVSSIFSFGNMAGRIFLFPGHALVSGWIQLWPMFAAVALLGVSLEIWVIRREFARRREWAVLTSAVLASYTGFFILLIMLGSATGMEDRYFKPLGFILVPGLVAWICSGTRKRFGQYRGLGLETLARSATAAILIASSCYGVGAAVNRARYNLRANNVGNRGFTQNGISREGLAVLHALDRSLPPDTLVVLPLVGIALDVARVRTLPTQAALTPPGELASMRYHGRVRDLIVAMDPRMHGTGQDEAFLRSFADYDPGRWVPHRYGEWIFYHQGSFAGWPASP